MTPQQRVIKTFENPNNGHYLTLLFLFLVMISMLVGWHIIDMLFASQFVWRLIGVIIVVPIAILIAVVIEFCIIMSYTKKL